MRHEVGSSLFIIASVQTRFAPDRKEGAILGMREAVKLNETTCFVHQRLMRVLTQETAPRTGLMIIQGPSIVTHWGQVSSTQGAVVELTNPKVSQPATQAGKGCELVTSRTFVTWILQKLS